jgi:alkanesulfonate monooxygenase SsuD/methylene tetrahydromethanopterin reductase-like flavin-dependent oxidoreductase (luciferase family)
MTALRFGVVSESVREGRAWLDFARRVEGSGIDVLLLRDHFSAGPFGQQLAPFSGLAAAAAATTRLRLGTLVLSNDFRHPAIVAHEAGTPVHRADASYRIDGLDLDVLPMPRPGSPRLLVGAGGPRMLRLAARHADIVGILPAPIRDSTDSDDPRDRLPAAFDAKVGVLREAAGDRFGNLEISAIATFIVTGDRRAATEDLIARRGWTGIDTEQVWRMPTIFIGSPDQIRADLRARRERFGLSYLVAGEDSQPAVAEVISGL